MEHINSWVKGCSFAAMLFFAASHGASAKAINCATAASRMDKVICSDSELSTQDAKLNQDYDDAMHAVSSDGQSGLRVDQRNWLRYRAAACGFADDDRRPGNMYCIVRQFIRRENTLWLIAHQQGPSPYVFSVRSTFATTPDPSGDLPFWSESSIPQIDRTSLPAGVAWSDAQAWNALMVKRIGGPETRSVCPGGKGDISKDPNIYLASTLLISVTENRDDQCHDNWPNLIILRGQGPFNGLPPQDHFMSETQYNIVMMRGDVHELVPADLFTSGDAWKRLLTERVEQEVGKQAHSHPYDWHPSADAVARVATDPSNWRFGGDAFRIRVNQAALSSPEFIGGFTVAISWGDLQSVLSFKGKRILNAPNW